MMAAPSPTLDPIKNSVIWHSFTLRGLLSPGSIPKGGMKGFKRPTGWDIEKAKGLKGATLKLTSLPPTDGTITLQFFTSEDFKFWDEFVREALAFDPVQQKAQGLAIYHPAFSSIGLTTVVVKHWTIPEHKGRGLYEVEISLLEWSPPVPKDIASAVEDTAGDASSDPTNTPQPDPRVTALQKQIALATQAAKT